MLKKSRLSLVMALVLVVALATVGCSSTKSTENNSAQPPADTVKTAVSEVPACTLEVVNGSSTVTLTEKELALIESVTFKATMSKKDGTSVEYEYMGLPMAKVLEAAGVTTYTAVSAVASDEYACEYTADMVKAEGSIIAYKRDGEALGNSGPLMSVLKDEASSTWCKTLVKLTVTP